MTLKILNDTKNIHNTRLSTEKRHKNMYVLLSHNLGTQIHTPLTPSHFTCKMYHTHLIENRIFLNVQNMKRDYF